jgi:hypothetical protein
MIKTSMYVQHTKSRCIPGHFALNFTTYVCIYVCNLLAKINVEATICNRISDYIILICKDKTGI